MSTDSKLNLRVILEALEEAQEVLGRNSIPDLNALRAITPNLLRIDLIFSPSVLESSTSPAVYNFDLKSLSPSKLQA